MRYVVRRLLFLFPTLFGMLVVVFMLLHITPGDPVEMLLDTDREFIPQEQIDAIRKDLGLDRPLHEQFIRYVGKVIQGDLGNSYRSKRPVLEHVKLNMVQTAHLALAGIFMSILIGIPAGIISAVKPNTIIDYVTLTISMIGLCAPTFWLGILALYVFAFQLKVFPMMGDGTGGGPLAILRHLALPATVIGAHSAALLGRLTRSSMLDALNQDYIRTAHSKGLSSRVVVVRHALRNAAIPVTAAAGTMFAYLLTGSVVVEMVFSRKGLGWLMVTAINGRDFPLVQGLILVFGSIIILSNLVTDLVIGAIDPRVSHD
jgi:ABC-type dipeptide/oligopeptide/nickel transport system permease component